MYVEDSRWSRIPKLRARLEKAAAVTLTHLPKTLRFPWTATVMLTNDVAVRKLNRDFRGIDRPTNVLSFPQFDPSELTKKGKKLKSVPLGDIVIAYQYIVVEAKKDHKILINHVTHLLIHGLLHLFGYDHMAEGEALRMERLEQKIMAKLGLPDPYSEFQPMRSKKGSPKHNRAQKRRIKP